MPLPVIGSAAKQSINPRMFSVLDCFGAAAFYNGNGYVGPSQ
jgi:hypothetical protein